MVSRIFQDAVSACVPANHAAPSAGQVGYRVSAGGSTPSLSSGTWANAASLPLTQGTWEIDGAISFGGPGGTTTNNWSANIATTSASSTGAIVTVSQRLYAGTLTGDESIYYVFQRTRVTVPAGGATYYLNAQASISGSGYAASGNISAILIAP